MSAMYRTCPVARETLTYEEHTEEGCHFPFHCGWINGAQMGHFAPRVAPKRANRKFRSLTAHAADPSKIQNLKDAGFPWVLGFVSYRSPLSYLRYLCLDP